METHAELCERIEGDVDNLLSMYALAEKHYPYTNIHGARLENDNDNRLNLQKFQQESNPAELMVSGSSMSLLFVYMMSRPGAKHLLDFSQVFKKPVRALGWFFLGNSILALWRVNYSAKMNRYNAEKYQLNLRASQNEQTHSVLRTMKFHLNTRKMNVFDANPV